MIITFTLYQYVIYMALFGTLGAILGITFCWYRINYKPLRGTHRERRTSNPSYRDAYTKGWEDGVYKRIHSAYQGELDILTDSTAFYDKKFEGMSDDDWDVLHGTGLEDPNFIDQERIDYKVEGSFLEELRRVQERNKEIDYKIEARLQQYKDKPVELEVRGELSPGSPATPSLSDW